MVEVFKLIQQKDKNSIQLLYENYGKKLYGYAIATWKLSEDESWDIVYKTLYKILEAAPKYTFESEQKFSSFIFKTFINYLRNYYRDKKTAGHPELIELKDNLRVSDSSEEKTKKEPDLKLSFLEEELNKLEDWQKILLLMRAQDVSYATIAEYIKKPEDQLKVYYMRLKKMIAEKMNERLTKLVKPNATI